MIVPIDRILLNIEEKIFRFGGARVLNVSSFRGCMLGILIISLFLSFMGDCVLSNPVPVPALSMPYEYIYATISLKDDELIANVTGIYTFVNFENKNVTMRYPVPPDATVVYVKVNNDSLSWWFTDEKYQTFVGNFTMIEWFIEPVPELFNVTVSYFHQLHLRSPQTFLGEYTFLYAMGTGRLLTNWDKQTTAYVTIKLDKNIVQSDKINLHTIERVYSLWIIRTVNFTLISEDGAWIVKAIFQSEPFQPLKYDLLLTFVEGIPPYISDPIQNPSNNIQPNQTVNITVNVSDIGIGVYNVTFYYTVGNGTTWLSIPMDRVSSLIFQATIPGLQEETCVSYKIVAYDAAGNKAENNNNNSYYTYYVVPEYNVNIILVILMLLTTLAIILTGKKVNSQYPNKQRRTPSTDQRIKQTRIGFC